MKKLFLMALVVIGNHWAQAQVVDSTNYSRYAGYPQDSVRFVGVYYNYPTIGQSTWYYSLQGSTQLKKCIFYIELCFPGLVHVDSFGTWTTRTNLVRNPSSITISDKPGTYKDSIMFDFDSNYNPKTANVFVTISDNMKIDVRSSSLYFGGNTYHTTSYGPSDYQADGADLPVSLLFFEGEVKDAKVQLSWATASEVNNDYFVIERSFGDFNVWETIATVVGAGNSNALINYNYTDQPPQELQDKVIYYRLRQIDFNGQMETFDVIPVMWRSSSTSKKIIFTGTSYEIISNEEPNIRTTISGQRVKAKPRK